MINRSPIFNYHLVINVKKKVYFKIINKAKNIVCLLLLACLVVAIIMFVVSKINGDVPSVFGYSVYRVSSGSMAPELEVGDIILSQSVEDPMSLKVGDIVTYKGSGELQGKLITHEVIVAPKAENGEIVLQTKGIANEIPDSPISADRVVSIMITKIEFLEAFYNFFFSPWGLLTIIALIILVFIDELIVMIKTITGNDTKPKSKDIDEIIGKIKSENQEIIPEVDDEEADEG